MKGTQPQDDPTKTIVYPPVDDPSPNIPYPSQPTNKEEASSEHQERNDKLESQPMNKGEVSSEHQERNDKWGSQPMNKGEASSEHQERNDKLESQPMNKGEVSSEHQERNDKLGSQPMNKGEASSEHQESNDKLGTHVMGAPAAPTSHPDNKKAAAFWGSAPSSSSPTNGGEDDDHHHHPGHPYVHYSPVEKHTTPMESILDVFNSWNKKAETIANNIWNNLKTSSSVSEAAWGKMNLTAKAITGGGFESLYKQTFATLPNEKLKKTFACYLSTAAGPVAGTLYLSDIHAAFCSDRPLSFTAPSGQPAWSYYKVMIPLAKIGTVNPVVMRENPSEKYIQIVTVDGHDFWFMGFVNYEKASRHLSASIPNNNAST